MKLYGLDVSFPTNKVRYVANALGIKYDFELVMPMSEQVQNDDYRELHPAEKVPALDDDGFKLFESNAIIKYLAQKNDSPLYPQDLKQRAKVDQWMDFCSIHIGGAIGRVFWNTIGVRFMGQEPDVASLEAGKGFLNRFLPVVDRRLGKSKYLAGETLTLADFVLLAALDPCEPAQVDLSKYKNLTKWRDALRKEDFYQVDRSFGEKMIAERMAQAS